MKKAKTEAMKKAKLRKTSSSTAHCRHCGEMTSKSTRHESGHREYDHDREKHEDIRWPSRGLV